MKSKKELCKLTMTISLNSEEGKKNEVGFEETRKKIILAGLKNGKLVRSVDFNFLTVGELPNRNVFLDPTTNVFLSLVHFEWFLFIHWHVTSIFIFHAVASICYFKICVSSTSLTTSALEFRLLLSYQFFFILIFLHSVWIYHIKIWDMVIKQKNS